MTREGTLVWDFMVAVPYHLTRGTRDDSQAMSKDGTHKAGILSDFKYGVPEKLLAASAVIVNRDMY